MPTVNLILGDQLFRDLSGLPDAPIVMVEDEAIATKFRYHTHKLILTFSAMRHFSRRQVNKVTYHRLGDGIRMQQALKQQKDDGIGTVATYEPADRSFLPILQGWCDELQLKLELYPNPMFLTSAEEWNCYRSTSKRSIMADFYIWQRRRLGILVDEKGQPTGGRWSFDEENRKPLPSRHVAPHVSLPSHDPIKKEVIREVKEKFSDHAGQPERFCWPVTHEEAEELLDRFLDERFDRFGDYEDAISSSQPWLYHSLISPLINVGLVTPGQVVSAALRRHAERPVPLNSLEGFLRQVIGWREYIRGVHREDLWSGYEFSGRLLGDAWSSRTTDLPPVDDVLKRLDQIGWCHHIERLMVLSSVMFMCEVNPQEVYRFFMEKFVDASEWVMEPNVYGMSQFVSPTFATKPYISGSAYVLKMSDYRRGEWCEVWDGLYWSTISRMKDEFAKNPRMTVIVRQLEKMDPSKKARIFDKAQEFRDRVCPTA